MTRESNTREDESLTRPGRFMTVEKFITDLYTGALNTTAM